MPASLDNKVALITGQDTASVVERVGQKLRGTAKKTTGWYDYRTMEVGRMEVPPDPEVEISVRAGDSAAWKSVNFRAIQLNDVN